METWKQSFEYNAIRVKKVSVYSTFEFFWYTSRPIRFYYHSIPGRATAEDRRMWAYGYVDQAQNKHDAGSAQAS